MIYGFTFLTVMNICDLNCINHSSKNRFYFNRSSLYYPLHLPYIDLIRTPSLYYLIKDKSYFYENLLLFRHYRYSANEYDTFWIIMKHIGCPLATLKHGWFHRQLFDYVYKKEMGEFEYIMIMEILMDNYKPISLSDFCFCVMSYNTVYKMIEYNNIFIAIHHLGPPYQLINITQNITVFMLLSSLSLNYYYLISKKEYDHHNLYDIFRPLFLCNRTSLF